MSGGIISLGSVNVDIEVRGEEWPRFGESRLGSDFLMAGGGKAANVAYQVRRLGVAVRLIGHVGDDLLREAALSPLRAAGVDLTGIKTIVGCPTGLAMILVPPNGHKATVAAPNANLVWTPADADDAAAAVARAPTGSLLIADLNVPDFVVLRAAEAARQRGFPIILDPSPTTRMLDRFYQMVGYITPDHDEAEQLTEIPVHSADDAFQAGQVLVDRGIENAFVKLPRGGCVVVSPGVRRHLPTLPEPAIDTNGAGDAFAAALGVALLEGHSLVEAGRWAVAAAHLAVLTYGAQPSSPTRADIEKLLAQHQARDQGRGLPAPDPGKPRP